MAQRTKLPASQKRKNGTTVPREVTRNITKTVMAILWGRAAARCEFAGCNRPLWKSPVTQEPVNIAQMAHIYSFGEGGPRGNIGVTDDALNGVENLLLVCHACHRKIDQKLDGGRYSVDLLRHWKSEHERRIEVVTGVSPNKRSHVLLYGANIGEQNSSLNFNDAALAMFPDYFPATDQPLELSMVNDSSTDRDADFWQAESRRLQTLFQQRVRERLTLKEISHLSVFALAPQPLLIQLGTLLGDITPATVFQRHREPSTWEWPTTALTQPFEIETPLATTGRPALVLSVSATITPDRIFDVLGSDTSIWTVRVPSPHNDVIKSRSQISEFHVLMRPLLNRIKTAHGQTTPLHVFPAVPLTVAMALGRIRMPKAEMPWEIYDQVNARGGFIPALTIS